MGPHGRLNVEHLPFEVGQRVDVVISLVSAEQTASANRYPLAGLTIEYEMPFAGVVEECWEATR